MKRVLTVTLLFIGALVGILSPPSARAQEQVASIEQLTQQYESLRAIQLDPATPPEVREMNLDFLKERRGKLLAALRARAGALRKYQDSAGPALTAREQEVVAGSIRELEQRVAGLAADETPAPAAPPQPQQRPAAAQMTLASYAPAEPRTAYGPAAAAGGAASDKIIATLKRSDGATADVTVTVARSINKVKVTVRDGSGAVIGRVNTYDIPREDDTVTLPSIRLADGENTITVSDLGDNHVSAPVVVTGGAGPRRQTPTTDLSQRGLVGLLVGGVVASQQAENFSQADPFFGFAAGYSGTLGKPRCVPDRVDPTKCWRNSNGEEAPANTMLHYRIEGIFQVQPKKEEAPPEDEAAGEDGEEGETPDPTDFRPFLASRKSFDIKAYLWLDRPFLGSPHVYVGPYFAIGGSTYVDKNELFGDQDVRVEDDETAEGGEEDADDGEGQMELDTSRSKIDNDINLFYEVGGIVNIFKDEYTRKELFMQTIFAYGSYEGLAGLNPGKTGFLNNSRNRFIGKLRLFPRGLDSSPDGGASSSPMFGVELNAGRGPDQLKFFTGVATAFKLAKVFN